MKSIINTCIFACSLFITFILSNGAYAAVGDACASDTDCIATRELCETEFTNACRCDEASGYVIDPNALTSCVKNCGNPVNPTGYTLTHGGGSTGTLEGYTATVACATGYSGTPSPAEVECQANGTWETPSGCTGVDCGEPPSQTGYSATKDGGTTYDETATVTCDTGNGYTGTPPEISCGSDGSWTAYSGCSLAADCGTPSASTGYIPGTPDMTTEGGTASVSCDSANGYTGTAADITCQADDTWSAYSGCYASGNGASEIRQTFSFVILTGSLIIALKYM